MTSKDNFEFAHEHRREVAWMSQNTNTLPVHPSILEAIRTSADEREFNLYPPKAGIFGLSDAIREDLGLDDADMILTNGGIEGEYIATRALLKAGDEALSTDPSFLPLESITPATKMLLAIDPNNPLGSGYSRSQIKGLADIARDHGLWLMDDITYRDFNADHVLATDFYPEKTLLSYSFSKAPGLAGLRIGAIIGPPDAIKSLRRFDTNVLGVNVLAQCAALAALQSKKEWLPGIRRICAKNQETIRHTVAKVDGASLPVFPSKANMFVIDLAPTGVKPEVVEERLLFDHLVHTRAGSYLSKKHGGEFLRVSFTVSEADCKRFADSFPAVMDKLAK
ncbi:MAG: aminotransferase class I/II-fold pyridoxal phosphate-dependent enzyme [Methanobacteriota archaeon]|nr:MAG: aminotransferase class I/II-fold pyridoxal phosphate-dependent enzyme [Euryarchaeota archaeon]